MGINDYGKSANRRDFLGKLTGAAALAGLGSLTAPVEARAGQYPDGTGGNRASETDPDEWFKNIKGSHRMVFDATVPKDLLTFGWPRVFLMSNMGTGSPEKDCGVVLVLRHDAIPFAMQDSLWEKYKFGETFKVKDPRTKAAATRNPFWKTKPDDYKIPGIGAVQIGIEDLQASGVMICVCEVALTVHSTVVGMETHQEGAVVKKEWLEGLLPGIQPMPSGVWALGRAQEHGCGYCFAG